MVYQVNMDVRRFHSVWRLHPPCMCGIPGIHGTQSIPQYMALVPALKVWNSRKSWKSAGYTQRACTPSGSVEFQEIMELRHSTAYGACTPSGSVEFQEIVEVCRLHPTRLHPLWKCGIPGNRGSLPVTPNALAPPLEVWNSRKSWNSDIPQHMALAPSLEVWNSRNL